MDVDATPIVFALYISMPRLLFVRFVLFCLSLLFLLFFAGDGAGQGGSRFWLELCDVTSHVYHAMLPVLLVGLLVVGHQGERRGLGPRGMMRENLMFPRWVCHIPNRWLEARIFPERCLSRTNFSWVPVQHESIQL